MTVVGPGYLFGDIDLAKDRDFSYSLVSLEKNAEVYILHKEIIWRFLKHNDNAREIFIRSTEEKEQELLKRIANPTQKKPEI